jgi:hypothetical protein
MSLQSSSEDQASIRSIHVFLYMHALILKRPQKGTKTLIGLIFLCTGFLPVVSS